MQSTKSSRPFISPESSQSAHPDRPITPIVILTLGVVLLLGLPGCQTIDQDWDKPVGEAFVPTNYYQKGPIPPSVRRVALLPLYSGEWDHIDLTGLQQAFAAELGKHVQFEVVSVSPERLHRIFGVDQITSVEPIAADKFETLVREFGADAILFTDLTAYHPYRPIVMGIRCKLVESDSVDILWSFDTVFDSGNPTVSTAARRYHLDESAPPYPLQNSSSILQSPLRYSKYVADAVFATLPER
jgi:hypothetical protein